MNEIEKQLNDLELLRDSLLLRDNHTARNTVREAMDTIKDLSGKNTEYAELCDEIRNTLNELSVKARAYKMTKWERDVALEQLSELGYQLGEKVRKNGWIPCKERLPEDNETVLFTRQDEFLDGYYVDTCKGWWLKEHLESIIAWQPFPEPYKESNKNE